MPQQEEEMIKYFLSQMIGFFFGWLLPSFRLLCCFSCSSSSIVWYTLGKDLVFDIRRQCLVSLLETPHSSLFLIIMLEKPLPSQSLLILLCLCFMFMSDSLSSPPSLTISCLSKVFPWTLLHKMSVRRRKKSDSLEVWVSLTQTCFSHVICREFPSPSDSFSFTPSPSDSFSWLNKEEKIVRDYDYNDQEDDDHSYHHHDRLS